MEEKLNQVINILDNFLHPIEYIKETGYDILVTIQNLSFDICLIAGFIALLLYVFGYKNGKRWAFTIPCIYIILNIIIGAITHA